MTTFRGPPPGDEPGVGALTLPGLLDEVCRRHGAGDAVVFPPGEVRLSYTDLRWRARQVAQALLALGLTKGTRVAVLLGNRPEWIEAAFGVTMAGGVMVPLNTWFEPPELDYVLRHCDASTIITQDRLLHRNYLDELSELCPELAQPGPVRSTRFPYLRHLIRVGPSAPDGASMGWDDFLAAGDVDDGILDATAAEVSPADDAVIIYTSGSTARPRVCSTAIERRPCKAGASPATSASTSRPARGAPFRCSGRPGSP
jgi:fatty-acyl-CoA synthase